MKTQMAVKVTTLSVALAVLAPTAFAQTTLPTGVIKSSTYALPNSINTAGEHEWVFRMMHYHSTSVVPRRMYSATCTAPGGTRKFFHALSTKYSTGSHGGMIISGDLDTSTGVVGNLTWRELACKEMGGVVASSDCSTVTAMCRRPSAATGATRDLVAALANTAVGNAWRSALTSEAVDDQMWLYEWKGTPAAPTSSTSTYNSYVVSKAIGGGSEYGHQNLVMTGTHYGVSMKSTTVRDTRGVQHQADSFVAVTRASVPGNTAIDTARGWSWACASGHTLANRPVLSSTGKFGAFCTTDWNSAMKADGITGDYSKAGIYMRVEGKPAALTWSLYLSPSSTLKLNGGGTSILPTANGEFIGTFVGSNSSTVGERSMIGLMRFNSDGAATGGVWVKSDSNYFLSYPQLVSLGNDSTGTPRYLLGWARMMPSNANSTYETPSPDSSKYMPTKYFVQEIDANGNAKSQALEVANGWGEQDQMISLGNGRAGWVYRPGGQLVTDVNGTVVPQNNSLYVTYTTYKSTGM